MDIVGALRAALVLVITVTFVGSANAERDSLASKEVDAAVLQQMKDQRIPGLSIEVVRDGTVIKAAGYGFANLEVSAPAKVETVYSAGSITKQFVASAIMLLAEQGKTATFRVNAGVLIRLRDRCGLLGVAGAERHLLSNNVSGSIRRSRNRKSSPKRQCSLKRCQEARVRARRDSICRVD